MNKVLVLSYRHHLIPFAHRLRLEGRDVEVVVWRARYERAWDGRFTKVLRSSEGTISAEHLEPVVHAAEQGEVTVMTDVWDVGTIFGNAQRMFGVLRDGGPGLATPLRLGGWFDGERWHARHLLMVDMGVWPGGLGPLDPGAATLMRLDTPLPEPLIELYAEVGDRLKRAGFQGLAQASLTLSGSTGNPHLDVVGVVGGWPPLHTHAFVSELGPSLGEVLEDAPPRLERRFVVVVPVSLPPWPRGQTPPAPADLPIEGLSPQQQGRVFWHDLRIDEDGRRLLTAGLDGLVGVARGAADTFGLARLRAMDVAGRILLPERQLRPDAGACVEPILTALEQQFGVVV